MIRLGQCKHVFFGPCHDNGYLPVLEEYKRNPAFATRFSLISGTPPELGFRQLGFAIDKYDDIFRTSNLAPRAPASPPSRLSSPRSGTPLPTPVTSVGSYTKAAPGSLNSMTISLGSKKPGAGLRKSYLVNAFEERLDSDLPRADPAAEKRYADRVAKLGYNYCNKYHLLDNCPNGDYCNYEHGEKLPAPELSVLRLKCRSLKCVDTYYCDKFDCPFSHHCKMGNKCTLNNCRWVDTHHVDLVSFPPRGSDCSAGLPLLRVCVLTWARSDRLLASLKTALVLPSPRNSASVRNRVEHKYRY